MSDSVALQLFDTIVASSAPLELHHVSRHEIDDAIFSRPDPCGMRRKDQDIEFEGVWIGKNVKHEAENPGALIKVEARARACIWHV